MLKKLLISCTFFFVLSAISVSGQTFSNTKNSQDIGFISMEMNPSVIIVVDSVYHKVDSKTADEIKPVWMEKVVVMKDETTQKMYGNKNGVIFIYTLKEYKKEVLEVIEKTKATKGL